MGEKPATNIGFASMLADEYILIFIGQQFRAGQAMNATPAAIPVR